jgi:hypothetical protein
MSLKEEIKALFDAQDNKEVERQFFYSEFTNVTQWDEDCVTEFKAELNKLGVNFNHEARHGGEGKGDAFWTVYSFTKGDEKVFVRFDGWYQSYNGAEYTEWFFVELKEVVVTQYFKTT